MAAKILLKFAPLIIPVVASALTPMWTALQDWIAAHPVQTVITGAVGAVMNWLVKSPIQDK